MLSLAALALAASTSGQTIPSSFDLASIDAARQEAIQHSMRRRYLPVDADLPAAEADDFSFRWKFNKVKLKMKLDLPY